MDCCRVDVEQDDRYDIKNLNHKVYSDSSIGSGIFVSPVKVLVGTGSVGISLIFWSFGAIVSTCGLLVWLELGLSVPFRKVRVTPGPQGEVKERSVPQNGGEMNYVSQYYICFELY